jgi:hypothetical protein
MPDDDKPIEQIEKLLTDKGKEALTAVRQQIDPLWEPSRKRDWRPPDVDRRLTWALTKKGDEFVVSMLADQEDSWATRKARELEQDFPEAVVWTTTGQAQSSYPDSKPAPHATSGEIRPGASIGHGGFQAGTLGCLVTVPGDVTDTLGVLTAAHVVALNKSVLKGDNIYSPGKPDIKNLLQKYVIGELVEWINLMPVSGPGQVSFQDIDVAFVDLSLTNRKIPKWNEVPDPQDPSNNKIRLKKIIAEKDLPNYLNKEVYKFGRTTGFTRGKFVYHHIAQRAIKLPNNKLYLYAELLGIVSATDESPFSRPGDSGAPVYTADGSILGFVIGADGSISLCFAAERSLSELNAQLIGVKGT